MVQCLIVKDHDALASFAQTLLHQLFEPGDKGLPAFRHSQQQAARSIEAFGTQGGGQLHKGMFCRVRRCQFKVILVPGAVAVLTGVDRIDWGNGL